MGDVRAAETIPELEALVPKGGRRLFEHWIDDDAGQRFYTVHQNHDYNPDRLSWRNRNWDLENGPWIGSRYKSRISISWVPEPDLIFKGARKHLIDFFTTGNGSLIMSERLVELIERMDPGSLEKRPVVIKAKDGEASYWLVLPERVLYAIDLSRTDVLIWYDKITNVWIRKVSYPQGVRFRDVGADVHHFRDGDALSYVWSRELIDAAKEAGMRGLYTKVPQGPGISIDRL